MALTDNDIDLGLSDRNLKVHVRNRLSGFVDTNSRLNSQEKQVFQEELGRLETSSREDVIGIVTSWMQEGIEQGIERGAEQEARSLVLRLLSRKVGELPRKRDRTSSVTGDDRK